MVKDKKTKDKEELKKKKKVSEPLKNDEHLVEVDTKESVDQKDDDLTARINQLYGISSGAAREEKQYDPKELEETRKKLILLLIGIIIFGVVVIVIMINPFKFVNNTSVPEKEKEQKEEKVEDDTIPLGEIDLTNDVVFELNGRVSFGVSDYLEIDLFPLYVNDTIEMNNVSNDIKLYLFKRSAIFENMINDAGTEAYLETCKTEGLVLTKETFDKAFAKFYGPNVTYTPQNINYLYYSEYIEGKKMALNYENGNYVIRCNEFTENETLVKYAQHNLFKAIKTENGIELYQNIVFINETGVYKDTNFTQVITKEQSAKYEDYITQGNVYKYTFTEDKDNYYLTKIEKTN